MRQLMSMRRLALLLAVVAATCLGATSGHATNIRTWVSNVGNDTGSCTVTSPCLTFAYALTQTSSGGEINCLTPGGFGAVTINISVTIDCEGASNGGITVTGTVGIIINTGGINVNLIGLDINGESGSGVGMFITSNPTVSIRNCKIYGFAGANSYGIGSNAGVTLVFDNVLIANNTIGIWENDANGVANMTVRNSNVNNNGTGIIVQVAGGSHAGGTIEQTTLAFNGTGLTVIAQGAVALLGGSTVVNNGTGVATVNGGTIYSFKNNQIGGNSTDGTPLTAYPVGPLN